MSVCPSVCLSVSLSVCLRVFVCVCPVWLLFATVYFSTHWVLGVFFLLGYNMILHAHSVPKNAVKRALVLGYRCPFPRASLVMCRETN